MHMRDWRQEAVDVVRSDEPKGGSGATQPLEGYRGASFIRAQLQVFGNYAEGSALAVFIEDTLDRVNWHEIGRFPWMNREGVEMINVTAPFTDTLRVRWEAEAPQGTPNTFDFGVRWYAE